MEDERMFNLNITATGDTLDEILADIETTMERQLAELADKEPGELRRELEHDGDISCGVTVHGADVTAVLGWQSEATAEVAAAEVAAAFGADPREIERIAQGVAAAVS